MMATMGLGLLSSMYTIAMGAKQQSEAGEKAKWVPKSLVPDSAISATAQAGNLAKGRGAGAVEAERAVGEASATASRRTERASTSGAQVQAGISGAQAMESKSIRKIRTDEAKDKSMRENVYLNSLWKLAGIEKEVDDTNKANAYNVETAERSAGESQVQKGVGDMIGMGMMAGMMAENADPNASAVMDGGDGIAPVAEVPAGVDPAVITDPVIGATGSGLGMQNQVLMQEYQLSGSIIPFEQWVRLRNVQ